MPQQDNRLFIRFSSEEKSRLKKAVEEYGKLYPGGSYTTSSIARAAVLARLDEMEKEIAGKKRNK